MTPSRKRLISGLFLLRRGFLNGPRKTLMKKLLVPNQFFVICRCKLKDVECSKSELFPAKQFSVEALYWIHSFTEVVQKVQITNVDLDTHTELMLFLAKLNGDPVAITVGGLVHITKPLIVTVAGVVVTYFALLYELK
ncbi:uncharacterized protein [Acropora muricata]|uniref:uncharacterized protein isoform X2 n=1 Tax=Acropora muricata TaxID=159855 RepID=UPI0034E47408